MMTMSSWKWVLQVAQVNQLPQRCIHLTPPIGYMSDMNEIKSHDIFSSDLFTYKYKSCHSV